MCVYEDREIIEMRNKYYITFALCVLALITGCNKLEDYVTTQEANFKKYLSSQKAYDREDYDHENNSVTNVKFYDQIDGVFRYIVNENREERPAEDSAIVKGDSIWVHYDAYIFEGTRRGRVFDTNRASTIKSNLPNLNTEYWSTDPLQLKVGDGQMLPGIEKALEGCRPGDEVQMLLTTDKAYGKRPLGIVPQHSAVMFVLYIEYYSKQ